MLEIRKLKRRIENKTTPITGQMYLSQPAYYYLGLELKTDKPVMLPLEVVDSQVNSGQKDYKPELLKLMSEMTNTVDLGMSLVHYAALLLTATEPLDVRFASLGQPAGKMGTAIDETKPEGKARKVIAQWTVQLTRGEYTNASVHPSALEALVPCLHDIVFDKSGDDGGKHPELVSHANTSRSSAETPVPAHLALYKLKCEYGRPSLDKGLGDKDAPIEPQKLLAKDTIWSAWRLWQMLQDYGKVAGTDYFRKPFADVNDMKDHTLRQAVQAYRAAALLVLQALQPVLLVYLLGRHIMKHPLADKLINREKPELGNSRWETDNKTLDAFAAAPWVHKIVNWFGAQTWVTAYSDQTDTIMLPTALYDLVMTGDDDNRVEEGRGKFEPHKLVEAGTAWRKAREQLVAFVGNEAIMTEFRTIAGMLGYSSVTRSPRKVDAFSPDVVHTDTLHTDQVVNRDDLLAIVLANPAKHVSTSVDAQIVDPVKLDRTIGVPRDMTMIGDEAALHALDPRIMRPGEEYRGDPDIQWFELNDEALATYLGAPSLDKLIARIEAEADNWKHLVIVETAPAEGGTREKKTLKFKSTMAFRSRRTEEIASGWRGTYLKVPYSVPTHFATLAEAKMIARMPLATDPHFGRPAYVVAGNRVEGPPTNFIGFVDPELAPLTSRSL